MGDLSANLSRHEWRCGCDYPECRDDRTPVDIALVSFIQSCIDHFTDLASGHEWRVACHINSGYRCVQHNADIGSKSNIHTLGMAADIWMEYVDEDGHRTRIPDGDVADWFEANYPGSCGIGRYPRDTGGWTHIDSRTSKARWTA